MMKLTLFLPNPNNFIRKHNAVLVGNEVALIQLAYNSKAVDIWERLETISISHRVINNTEIEFEL